MDLLQAARFFSKEAHKGESLKFVVGPYDAHPKAVSERQWGVSEKVVALLHDVVETHVKRSLGKYPDPADEERVIKKYLEEINRHFQSKGCDISDLIADINALTKRVTDTNYKQYIQKIINHSKATGSLTAVMVKLADLEDNSLPERNPSPNIQTDKDRERLARYAEAIRNIYDAFPGIELRSQPNKKLQHRDLPGHGQLSTADLSQKERQGSRGFLKRALRPGNRKKPMPPKTPGK